MRLSNGNGGINNEKEWTTEPWDTPMEHDMAGEEYWVLTNMNRLIPVSEVTLDPRQSRARNTNAITEPLV